MWWYEPPAFASLRLPLLLTQKGEECALIGSFVPSPLSIKGEFKGVKVCGGMNPLRAALRLLASPFALRKERARGSVVGGGTLVGMMATKTVQAGVCNVPNRTIFEGDNLDVMRGMNDGCVDLIYLDPPFNSNRDYAAPIGSEAAGAAFKDTWDLTDGLLGDSQCEPSKDAEQGLEFSELSCIDFKGKLATT